MRIAVADIGGTNARFALADVIDGRVIWLSDPVVLPAARHAGLAEAWKAFGAAIGAPLPRHAALGVAGPVTGGPVRFVNSHWVVDPATLDADLGLDSHLLLNDFGAMAHAVDALDEEWLVAVCGPDAPLPEVGAISVIGPGTGLGVAVLQRLPDGRRVVLETEGSHVHFAPLDAEEARLCGALAARHGRVSIERIVSGPGLGAIVRAEDPADSRDDAALWQAACEGELPGALDRFLAAYGAAAGDLALAHGATGVALTGGLTNRLLPHLAASRFSARFCAKGRYRARMEGTPVRLVTHPQPGLFGAAAAYARLR
ncbi:MAG TPA: glucokinase [Novosphingobium sp.]|nr:glucokinase [Novosphingobium sp.]